MARKSFIKWLDIFIEEKKPINKIFNIEHKGITHYIQSEQVIDLIKIAPDNEQKAIKNILVKIDFCNGDINHFFEHLATGYIKTNY